MMKFGCQNLFSFISTRAWRCSKATTRISNRLIAITRNSGRIRRSRSWESSGEGGGLRVSSERVFGVGSLVAAFASEKLHRVAQVLTIVDELCVCIFKGLRGRSSTYVPSLVP